MQIFKKPNFKFMKFKYIALILSGVLIATGLINLLVGKGITQGIDFAGGTLVRLIFDTEVPIEDVRGSLSDAGLGNSQIQEIEGSQREYQVRTMTLEGEEEMAQDIEAHEIMGNKVVEALESEESKNAAASGLLNLNALDAAELTTLLESQFPEQAEALARSILGYRVSQSIITDFDKLEADADIPADVIQMLKNRTYLSNLVVLSKETVGPQVGKDLRFKATQATVWALIGMLIYIGLRFRFAYGVSAIVTLAHDVLITLGMFSFTNREMNLPVIAAIMTIVGYSLNDTIVIFDRVRDNVKLMRKKEFSEILDTSINQTLGRTIITSGTTLLTVLAMFLFGGPVINDFAFTLMIGVVVGTYSSIYQSCSILFFWNKIFKPKKGMGK
jgi:preprotein translocase subunit SecF